MLLRIYVLGRVGFTTCKSWTKLKQIHFHDQAPRTNKPTIYGDVSNWDRFEMDRFRKWPPKTLLDCLWSLQISAIIMENRNKTSIPSRCWSMSIQYRMFLKGYLIPVSSRFRSRHALPFSPVMPHLSHSMWSYITEDATGAGATGWTATWLGSWRCSSRLASTIQEGTQPGGEPQFVMVAVATSEKCLPKWILFLKKTPQEVVFLFWGFQRGKEKKRGACFFPGEKETKDMFLLYKVFFSENNSSWFQAWDWCNH